MTAHPRSGRPPLAQLVCTLVLLLGAVATVAGLILWWPSSEPVADARLGQNSGPAAATEIARVESTDLARCGSPDNGKALPPGPPLAPVVPVSPECPRAFVRLETGPQSGKLVLLEIPPGPDSPKLTAGDEIRLGRGTSSTGVSTYAFEDYSRGIPLAVWAGAAVLVLAVVGAWRGLRSVIGIGWALLVVVGFLLPSLVEGNPPELVALVGASAVMYPVLYLVHGVGLKTHAALVGTLTGMVLASVLGRLAVATCRVTGLGEESVSQVQRYLGHVSVSGILLAGFVIGVMGVLNDVTISQSATVFQLRRGAADSRSFALFRSAMEVGRDHIASVTYTLVLAYVGSALPMLLLFAVGDRGLVEVLTSDVVAVEVVRSLVGVIALALCVPLTTAVAVLLAAGASEHQLHRAADGGHHH